VANPVKFRNYILYGMIWNWIYKNWKLLKTQKLEIIENTKIENY